MEIKDVDFNFKRYISKEGYISDGCPVQYFEFRAHEYYGLIACRTNFAELEQPEKFTANFGVLKAFEVYAKLIGGSSFDIRKEGYPFELSKSEALLKFLLAADNRNAKVQDLLKDFNSAENAALLVDGTLV